MTNSQYLAFDIGASSGRAILGTLDGCAVTLEEIHRFPNEMILRDGHYYWDINRLFAELMTGLRLCVKKLNVIPVSIGIDTWGVDFGLLDGNNQLIDNPFAYRDSLTEEAMEQVFKVIRPKELYAKTGIQFLRFNSLFQLWSLKKKFPHLLLQADKLLFIPDLLGFMFTGVIFSEYTIASTSQILNPKTRNWYPDLLIRLGLPIHILDDILDPGTEIGPLKPGILSELGINAISVVAVGAHDTASAIAAIPAEGNNWAYISCGTWSLMGIETDHPILTEESFKYLFTNEGGVGKKIRYLKNITGLWLLQECKKVWDREETVTYEDLIGRCMKVKAFRSIIDPDDPVFMNPEHMPLAIQEYCLKTNQEVPRSIAEITRCIFESLALKYRIALEQLRKVSPHPIEKIHMIGGGSLNTFLCQLTSDATGLPVIAGPAEATALGNILVQIACHQGLSGLDTLRAYALNSVTTRTYLPKNTGVWEKIVKREAEDVKAGTPFLTTNA
ncbi:MAG: rhamnulokinase family protein [Bacteroidales bacterium]|jgi:rhamnulokinase